MHSVLVLHGCYFDRRQRRCRICRYCIWYAPVALSCTPVLRATPERQRSTKSSWAGAMRLILILQQIQQLSSVFRECVLSTRMVSPERSKSNLVCDLIPTETTWWQSFRRNIVRKQVLWIGRVSGQRNVEEKIFFA